MLCAQFVAAAESLLSALSPELFAGSRNTQLTFVLGPSPTRALEVYNASFVVPGGGQDGAKAAQACSAMAASKTVLRELILATAAGSEGPASRGKLCAWAALRMLANAVLTALTRYTCGKFGRERTAMRPSSRQTPCAGATKLFVLVRRPAGAELLPGFLPKRGLQLRMRKGLQVHCASFLKASAAMPHVECSHEVSSAASFLQLRLTMYRDGEPANLYPECYSSCAGRHHHTRCRGGFCMYWRGGLQDGV